MRGSKAQRIRAINCQLGKEDAGCLTNFCAAVNACIDSTEFGNTFSTGLTNTAGTVTANISTGIAGGQTIYGGVVASENLTISSTAHATKGFIYVGSVGSFDGVNSRLGLLSAIPTHTLTLGSTSTGAVVYNTADQTTNFERLFIGRSSNVATVGFQGGGSASSRTLRLTATNGSGGSSSTLNINRGSAPYFGFDISNANSTTGIRTSLYTTGSSSTASSGTTTFVAIAPAINQTSTAGYTGLLINPTETAIGSGAKSLILAQVGGATKFTVTNTGAVVIGAGSATAGTAPLKLTSGTNLTTAEAGAIEYNGADFFATKSGTTRGTILISTAVTTEVVVSDTTLTVTHNGVTYKILARA